MAKLAKGASEDYDAFRLLRLLRRGRLLWRGPHRGRRDEQITIKLKDFACNGRERPTTAKDVSEEQPFGALQQAGTTHRGVRSRLRREFLHLVARCAVCDK